MDLSSSKMTTYWQVKPHELGVLVNLFEQNVCGKLCKDLTRMHTFLLTSMTCMMQPNTDKQKLRLMHLLA